MCVCVCGCTFVSVLGCVRVCIRLAHVVAQMTLMHNSMMMHFAELVRSVGGAAGVELELMSALQKKDGTV